MAAISQLLFGSVVVHQHFRDLRSPGEVSGGEVLRLSVVMELESVVTANLQPTSRLRESIMQKAFKRIVPSKTS